MDAKGPIVVRDGVLVRLIRGNETFVVLSPSESAEEWRRQLSQSVDMARKLALLRTELMKHGLSLPQIFEIENPIK
jgi:hypothetical protein